ncbi:MAG: hypothetical protein ABI564_08970 [Ideonella sp.]
MLVDRVIAGVNACIEALRDFWIAPADLQMALIRNLRNMREVWWMA